MSDANDQNFTLDDFFERFIKSKAEAGVPAYQAMMEAWKITKEGKMTPAVAREMARKTMP